MALPKRTLGRTGFEVTTLGYGAMELRGGPRGREVSEEDAGRLLNSLLDNGINFIDTSIDYGIAEERIGRHISHRRDEYVLASKCGCLVNFVPPPDFRPPSPHDFTRENIVAGVEQSLRRLNTDHLDIVQVHMSPSKQDLEANDVVSTLKELQQQGKVRFIGMSGTIPNLSDHIDMGVFDVFQIPYSALQRDHEALIDKAAAHGAGIIVRGGAARGAVAPDKAGETRGADAASLWGKANLDDLLPEGVSRMEFIVRFTASHPSMDTNIVGSVNPDHVADNVAAAAKGPLPNDVYEEAKRRLAAAGAVPAEA